MLDRLDLNHERSISVDISIEFLELFEWIQNVVVLNSMIHDVDKNYMQTDNHVGFPNE